ncbi:cytochrome b5-like heme/steroid binding domain-containing protein [Filobasidium floriforme]|uniref:cytochrome b5-like heme/steroid binding domain-containing protein n=1 Tax=Filobasidium floriforme TaxID=5210 RepID=UPI001E8E46B7|nr:cytochrome b5-like heme/steroid binding domain-containing protein [Filobasidium floriforme]KAH8084225.1 cytochrome b5-like heme/steroid binding domain-containing protein [Filobasidium floriforme]
MSTEQAPASAPSGTKTYTLKDLRENGTREKMYMLLHDKVYDITPFLDEHPGGDEVLVEEAGKDATEAFEDVGHSDEARAQLVPLYIGEFAGEKKSKKVAVNSTGVPSSASSSGPGVVTYMIPLSLFFAYLAWRVYFA